MFGRILSWLARRLDEHDLQQAERRARRRLVDELICPSCRFRLTQEEIVDGPYCRRCRESGDEVEAGPRRPRIGDAPRAFPLGRVH